MLPAPQVDGTATLGLFLDGTRRKLETQDAAAPTTTPTTASPGSENRYGDRVRLALIGGKMLEAVYMYMLFRQQPRLSADEMEVSTSSVARTCWCTLCTPTRGPCPGPATRSVRDTQLTWTECPLRMRHSQAQFTKLPELVEKWAECNKLREEMRHAVGMDVRDLRVRT